MPGLRVLGGRYELVERVGRGRAGTVWRARDRLLGGDVAVKEIVLPRGLDGSDLAAVCDRVVREGRAAARVRHPVVVAIHDVVVEDNHPWVVMDLVRGRSLADRIEDGGGLPVGEVARIGEVLAGGLRAIHDAGLVHRGLTPANVLVDTGGHVVLTGFGVATIEGDARFTASGLPIGAPGFMAPERLSGEASGPPSDLWALGAVLYAAVEARSPYEGSTPMVIASAVLTKEPAPPQRAGPLAPLLAGLFARNPADRPNARQIADHLASLARTPETLTDHANPPTRPGPFPGGPGLPEGHGPSGRSPAPPGGPGDRGPSGWSPAPPGRPDPGHPVGAPPRGADAGERRWWRRIPAFWVVTVVVIVVVAVGAGIVRYVTSRPAVDPCALLTAEQAKNLVPGAHGTFEKAKAPTVTDDCSWNQTDLSGLTVGVATYPTAQKATAALHNEENTYYLDPTLGVSGIGDEVHGFYTEGTKSVELLFRRNRRYAIVSYGGVDSVVPKATEQSKALQAARWVDARLAALDR